MNKIKKIIEAVKSDILVPVANVEIGIFDVQKEKFIDVIRKHNLVVLSGKNLILDLLKGDTLPLSYFAVGTNNTAVTINDTMLGTEMFRDSITNLVRTSNNLNVQYYLDSGSANGNTLAEAGTFGGSATGEADSGTLYARVTHSGIAKNSSIAITYSWDYYFV